MSARHACRRRQLGVATLALARVALFRGDPACAVELFRAFVPDLLNAWADRPRALEAFAWALAALERYEDSARLLGFLAAERKRSVMLLSLVDQRHHDRTLISTREALSPEAFSATWEQGAQSTLEQAVAATLGGGTAASA